MIKSVYSTVDKFLNRRLSTFSDWMIFLPHLLVYLIIHHLWVLPDPNVGDELRYFHFAENLLQGFYSPTDRYHINLWCGPGYPLFLTPFVALGSPFYLMRLINSLLLYGSMVYTYKALKNIGGNTRAFWITLAISLYLPAFQMLRFLHTEGLTIFLIALLTFWLSKIRKVHENKSVIVATGICIAFLAHTKVLFGYVLFLVFLLWLIRSIIKRKWTPVNTLLTIAVLGCFPYLAYTKQLTGKIFYWGNAGGTSLYSMSTLEEDEYGSLLDKESIESKESHKAVMSSLVGLDPVQRDAALKQAAIENIKKNPVKFSNNVVMNISRLFTNYPRNGKLNIGYPEIFYFIFGYTYLFVVLYIVGTFFLKIRLFTEVDVFIFTLLIVYLLGTALLCALTRMSDILLPFVAYLFLLTGSKKVKIFE